MAREFEEARKFALEGLEKEKEFPLIRQQFYFWLAEVEYRSKNHEKALEILQRGFKETKVPKFLWVQADWQIDAGDLKGAKESLAALSELHYDSRGLEYLRGKIYFAEKSGGRQARPWKFAAPISSTNPRNSCLSNIGWAYATGSCAIPISKLWPTRER